MLNNTFGKQTTSHTRVFDQFKRFKEGRTPIESNSASTVNVTVMFIVVFFSFKWFVHYEYVRGCQTANHVYHIEVLKRFRDAVLCKKSVNWTAGHVIIASWQRTCSLRTLRTGVFGKTRNPCGTAGTLFTWHGTLRLLALPPIERFAQRKEILRLGVHKTKCDESTKRHSENCR